MKAHIVLLPGDGIGPEVIAAAVRVARQAQRVVGRMVGRDIG